MGRPFHLVNRCGRRAHAGLGNRKLFAASNLRLCRDSIARGGPIVGDLRLLRTRRCPLTCIGSGPVRFRRHTCRDVPFRRGNADWWSLSIILYRPPFGPVSVHGCWRVASTIHCGHLLGVVIIGPHVAPAGHERQHIGEPLSAFVVLPSGRSFVVGRLPGGRTHKHIVHDHGNSIHTDILGCDKVTARSVPKRGMTTPDILSHLPAVTYSISAENEPASPRRRSAPAPEECSRVRMNLPHPNRRRHFRECQITQPHV